MHPGWALRVTGSGLVLLNYPGPPPPSIHCAGTWKATIAASNRHGEGEESPLSDQFTVGVTSKPVIDSVQVGNSGCGHCRRWALPAWQAAAAND